MTALILVVLLAALPDVTDSTLEETARGIEGELMSPCCWSQTVADHDSQKSAEIKREIRLQLEAGWTREQVLAGYVAQYGERIRPIPTPRGFNLLLFVLPALFVLTGLLFVVVALITKSRTFATHAVPRVQPEVDVRLEAELERYEG